MNQITLKHMKITTFTAIDGNTRAIEVENYTDMPKPQEFGVEKRILANSQTLLTEHIGCLDVLKHGETDELVLQLKRQPNGDILIKKVWTTTKDPRT